MIDETTAKPKAILRIASNHSSIISDHDIEYRLAHIREFIAKGNRVKVRMRFPGRQMAYRDRGRDVLAKAAEDLKDVAVLDQEPKMEGREMAMILRPY